MSTLRYTDGPVTVTLSGELEAFVRKALDAAGGETLRLVREVAEGVQSDAEGGWYGNQGVTRRTGKSGVVDVVERISDDEVRVSVGSTDLDKAKYVHRPGRLSTTVEEIDKPTYEAAKNRPGATLVFHARRDADGGVKRGSYYRVVHNSKASDGKYLLQELIRRPARDRLKAVLPDIGRAIARKAGGGSNAG